MNINDLLFFSFIFFYVSVNGTPPFINFVMFKICSFLNKTVKYCYDNIYSHYLLEDNVDSKNENQENNQENNQESVIVAKYEDKYLKEIRLLNKEWDLTEEELQNKILKAKYFFDISLENLKTRMIEIDDEIKNLETDINDDIDTVNFTETIGDNNENTDNNDGDNGDDDLNFHELTVEERNESRRNEILKLQDEYNKLKNSISTENGINELKIQTDKEAHEFIVNERIDKLKNTFVIEKTPQGNVLMIYNNDKGSFIYYSDCTIPYRYLEVVARKYIKLFGCRPLFVDMDEELKLFELKWTAEYESKKIKEAEEKLKADEAAKNNKPTEIKKNVFAKFKSYNKDAGGKISMAPPPKNSIPSKSITETKEDEKIILKERANRYTYEGKFANFNFLQKIDKKVFNKKLGLSFADFKKAKKN